MFEADRDAAERGTRIVDWARSTAVLSLLLILPLETVGQDGTGAVAPCDGRIVTEVVITPRDPSFLSFPPFLRPFARAVGLHHTTSRADMISGFVLMEEGRACTERERAESERILRIQPFLADATVRVTEGPGGGVRVEVETVDEIPTVFGMGFRELRPFALRFGNGNVGGEGIFLAAGIRRGFTYRTGVSLEAAAYQLFDRPYTLSLVAERAPLGSTLAIGLGHPFLTDLQRTAWHLGFRDVNAFIRFVPPEGETLSLGVERRFWDAGGVRRLGSGRHSAFVGALVTGEEVTPARLPVLVSDSGLITVAGDPLGPPPAPYRNLRLNFLVGVRALSFVPVRGFDAPSAVQDMATGVQLGAVAGWASPRLGSRDRDLFLAADLYAGHGSSSSFAGARLEAEARWDPEGRRWDGIVGSGRLAWYLKPSEAHTLAGSAEFGGAWRPRIPFQLRLGDRQSGVRGLASSRRSGAVRTIVRIEDRWTFRGPTRHGSFALAGFVDGGWVWAGEAPFGEESGTQVGAGIALLAAFPPESGRVWRLELARPLSGDPDARWELRLSLAGIRAFWEEPEDVARVRAGTAPSTIFTWP